ncbi:AAA family ATPase [Clostridium lundense]|uniref:AAA family ATPase n=1 Tax=Clostridium lundense TaxID=319475 RepID=UPI001FA76EE4|nr:AAA family ATPase [Clostridium lundense]
MEKENMKEEVLKLNVIDGKTLLEMEVKPLKYVISKIMPTGLHILAGSPKIGKSWLALWICNQISKGEKVWDFETIKSSTLYLSLEDTIERIHFRLSHITEEGSEQSFYSTEAKELSKGLEVQIENFLKEYPDTSLITIDTFQRIRDNSNDKNAYASDYDEVRKLKVIADTHDIAILLVHHLRKMQDSDPVNMVSGSTGIIGAVDGIYILEKESRTENKAKLHITGRDIEDMLLSIEFDKEESVWKLISYGDNSNTSKEEPILTALKKLITEKKIFQGTSKELLAELKKIDTSITVKPNVLARILNSNKELLKNKKAINYQSKKINGIKLVCFTSLGVDSVDGADNFLCMGNEEKIENIDP